MKWGLVREINFKDMKDLFIKKNKVLSNKKIRKFTISEIINRILATENKIFKDPGKSGIWNFIIKDNYLIKEIFLNNEIKHRLAGEGHILLEDRLIGIILNRIFSESLSFPIIADVIQIKNNIRGFYLSGDKKFCTKLIMDRKNLKKKIENEIKFRSKIAKLKLINAPRILEYSMEEEQPFFIEEFISGKKIDIKRDKELLIKVVKNIFRIYELNGIHFKKVNEVISDIRFSNFIDIVKKFGFTGLLEEGQIIEKIKSIINSKKYIPFSFCHGDLSNGNMILSGRNIYITDWESFKDMPISYSFAKLSNKVKEIENFCKIRIDKIESSHRFNLLSFKDQLALYHVKKISQIKKRIDPDGNAEDFRSYKKIFINNINKLYYHLKYIPS